MFVAITAGLLWIAYSYRFEFIWYYFAAGATFVAGVGLLDDLRPVSAIVRLCVQIISAIFLVQSFAVFPDFRLDEPLSIGTPMFIVFCFGAVASINIFNFMDGTDGLAASEGLFVGAAGASIMLVIGDHSSAPIAMFCVLIASSCAGFLLLNYPPARIFMGDVGSGFLGFSIASACVWSASAHIVSVWTWIILCGVFIGDATATLMRRLLRGENIAVAHRMHAYQRLARRWSSHGRVALIAAGINCFWLLPLAVISTMKIGHGAELAVLSIAPIIVGAWIIGAGQPDDG